MNVFKKIGSGFKWIGSKILWVLKRKETLIAVTLATDFLPIPALDKIVMLVRRLDDKAVSGSQKMVDALVGLPKILKEYGVDIEDEAQARLIIEIAVAIMKERARVLPVGKEK